MAQQQQQQQQQIQDEHLYPPQAADPAPNARNAAPVPPPQPAQQQYPQQPYPGHQAPQQQHPQQQYPGQMQQQPYPMQHQVIVQSSPHNGGSCSRKLENYKADQSFGLGLTQILIGVLCIIFNIVGIGLTVPSSNYYYVDEFQFYTGYGMWPSILFIIAGGFGIGARSKNPCPIITFMIMSIFAAIFTIFVVAFSSSGISTVSHEYYMSNSYYGYSYYANAYWTNSRSDYDNQKHGKLAMHSLMLILAFVELVVAIWSSAICCHAACCCRDQRGAVHAAPMVTYGGQMVNGQQQVFIHTQGQYIHTQGIQQQPQYAGGRSYPAAGTGLAQPSASTPGMPPAYSAASAPPAYGGPPHEQKSGMPPATN